MLNSNIKVQCFSLYLSQTKQKNGANSREYSCGRSLISAHLYLSLKHGPLRTTAGFLLSWRWTWRHHHVRTSARLHSSRQSREHCVLCDKLKRAHVDASTVTWIIDCFINRPHFMRLKGCASKLEHWSGLYSERFSSHNTPQTSNTSQSPVIYRNTQ